ncbi:hypothetical protein, partial [Pseudomonas syringae]
TRPLNLTTVRFIKKQGIKIKKPLLSYKNPKNQKLLVKKANHRSKSKKYSGYNHQKTAAWPTDIIY